MPPYPALGQIKGATLLVYNYMGDRGGVHMNIIIVMYIYSYKYKYTISLHVIIIYSLIIVKVKH